jgi:two-component system OmpR family sensor kinase
VDELLADLRERFASLVTDAGRPLEIDPELLGRDLSVCADPGRLQQAVGNLVDNTLRYGSGPITLSARAAGDCIEIHVCDEGAGFSEWLLPRAFDRFSRADPARQRGGVGLGLAVVQMIARAHGGEAGARNRPTGGADVWLSIPAGRREASAGHHGLTLGSDRRTT